MQHWNQYLARWQEADLLDAKTAERIYAFEAGRIRTEHSGWQANLVVLLGGVLLAAGVLLFVASHWDLISPLMRVLVTMSLLLCLHGGGALAAERFPALATALHAVGTIGAGAAIATIGQVFHMEEHWPAAVLLWALCAAAGWWYLRDQFQQICCLLLAPAWLISEWAYRAEPYQGAEVHLARMVSVFAAAYLLGFLHTGKRVVFGCLFGAGGLMLVVSVGVLSEGWQPWSYSLHSPVPVLLQVAALGAVVLVTIAVWYWRRRVAAPVIAALGLAYLLPWLRTAVAHGTEAGGRPWRSDEPSMLAHALVAALAGMLAWWGVRERSRALVNYGVGTFALAVGWFYYSSLLDMLGRSLGLIGLGVVLLLGGWLLERLRRRLLGEMENSAAIEVRQ